MNEIKEDPKEWFKKLWIEGSDASCEGEEDFEVVFAKYKDKWFEDFKEYFEEVGQIGDLLQHPKHILPTEGFKTILWNTSWEHADINNRK